jgi:Domain of unknown function (DUF4249)
MKNQSYIASRKFIRWSQRAFVVLAAWAFIGSIGCKQSYDPPVVSSPNTYLVVEGFINNGPDSTYYTLTHTFKLGDTATTIPELQASVTVEGMDNSSYTLAEIGNGVYGAPLTGLNPAVQYRLHIHTTGGKEYASAYVTMKVSPPIDSINWVRNNQGVQLYANTHDPQGNSRYYHWDYQETWEFTAAYYAYLQYRNDSIVTLDPNNMYYCWGSDVSTSILLNSSVKLAQDQIQMDPLVMIPVGDERISYLYSIMVKQYVLTPDAYAWWQLLQKNTEQIGSIFGVEPSTTGGNIHNLADSTELVIGYVSAGSIVKQRIYISNSQVQPWVYQNGCTEFATTPDSALYYAQQGYAPIYSFISNAGPKVEMTISRFCVDCTETGTNHKPSFWP